MPKDGSAKTSTTGRGHPPAAAAAAQAAERSRRLRDTLDLPQRIVIDNGPEFTGRALEAWAYANRVELHFIRPGKPIDNAYVESFNGKCRDECLNEHWFQSLAEAQSIIEAWRVAYNTVPPAGLARAADARGLRRSRLRGPRNWVGCLLGGCSGHDPATHNPGGTRIIPVADLGGRSSLRSAARAVAPRHHAAMDDPHTATRRDRIGGVCLGSAGGLGGTCGGANL
jgi:hypothetical protein